MTTSDLREESPEKLYGIGAVAKLTGVSVHTLRVWERRHGAVELQRTEGGRRLYTDEDVERLCLLKRLVDRGETIGRIATLSRGQLEERLGEFERRVADSQRHRQERPRVAVLGEFLGTPLEAGLAHADVVAIAARQDQFRSEVRRARPDVLLLDLPLVTVDSRRLAAELRRESGATRVVVIYGLGRREDTDLLAKECEVAMRAPVSSAELQRAIDALAAAPAEVRAPGIDDSAAPAAASGRETPSPRYSRTQLARLATVPSSVDCECPHHLVELIDRLTLFEQYSADCEHRNREDAALHAFLHSTTAQARSLIETALERVIEAENLDPGPP